MEDIFKNGYTIIPSLISNETCDKLKLFLDNKISDKFDDLPYNYFKGHNQVHLPNTKNDIPTEIIFNKKIHDIIGPILGKSYYMYSYTCNANLAKQDQPYHMDCSHFHSLNVIKKFGSPGPPLQLIVNVYLQNTNQENGSFDIVPKSHLFTNFKNGEIDSKYIKNSVRCNLPKGSVIIRDKRTWHRGTKNNTDKIRYMVSISYSISWYKLQNLVFDVDSKDLFINCPFSIWNLKWELPNNKVYGRDFYSKEIYRKIKNIKINNIFIYNIIKIKQIQPGKHGTLKYYIIYNDLDSREQKRIVFYGSSIIELITYK